MSHPRPSRLSHSRQRPRTQNLPFGHSSAPFSRHPRHRLSSPQIGLSDDGLSGLQPMFVPIWHSAQRPLATSQKMDSLKSPSTPRRHCSSLPQAMQAWPPSHRLTYLVATGIVSHITDLALTINTLASIVIPQGAFRISVAWATKAIETTDAPGRSAVVASSTGRGGITLKTPAAFCVIGFTHAQNTQFIAFDPFRIFLTFRCVGKLSTRRIVLTASAHALNAYRCWAAEPAAVIVICRTTLAAATRIACTVTAATIGGCVVQRCIAGSAATVW